MSRAQHLDLLFPGESFEVSGRMQFGLQVQKLVAVVEILKVLMGRELRFRTGS